MSAGVFAVLNLIHIWAAFSQDRELKTIRLYILMPSLRLNLQFGVKDRCLPKDPTSFFTDSCRSSGSFSFPLQVNSLYQCSATSAMVTYLLPKQVANKSFTPIIMQVRIMWFTKRIPVKYFCSKPHFHLNETEVCNSSKVLEGSKEHEANEASV